MSTMEKAENKKIILSISGEAGSHKKAGSTEKTQYVVVGAGDPQNAVGKIKNITSRNFLCQKTSL